MGGARTSPATSASLPLARLVDVLVGGALLLLALPLIGVLALAVRRGSNGPVLHRERARDRAGRPVVLLSFRTTLDGATTCHHERVRAVVGCDDTAVVTRAGRFMRATRTAHLPRLLNVVRGEASLL